MKGKHWSSKQVAEWLNISRKLLWRMVDRGEIPAVRITPPGKNSTLRFNVDELEAWYEARRVNREAVKQAGRAKESA